MEPEAVEARLARVEQALQAVEERLRNLEGRPGRARAPGESQPAAAASASALDFTLIGKSVLMIGGAYVLRALTELHLLPEIAGVLLAFLYAMFWIWMSDRALAHGRRAIALFDAGTAALIAGSLIWEATIRFHALTPSIASAMVVVAALALLWVARRREEPACALIATLMAVVTLIGVAIGSGDLLEATLAAAVVGVVSSMERRWPMYVTLAFAVVTDCLVLPLVVMTTMGQTAHSIAAVETVLVAVAVIGIVPATRRRARWAELGQAIAATVIGLGGAALIAEFHGGHRVAVASACLAITITAYAVALMRLDAVLVIVGALAAAIGSLLVIGGPALAMAWAAASLASAAVARSRSWSVMTVQAAFWAVAAGVASVNHGALLIAVSALVAVALSITASGVAPRSRFTLLAVATLALIAGVASFLPNHSPALLAISRTAMIAVAAVVLSMLSSVLPEAEAVARGLLVLGGLKLLIEDLRIGHATMMVVALALFGGAIVIVARRRPAVRHSGM